MLSLTIKQHVVHIHNGISLSRKKNDVVCSNLEGLRDYHIKRDKDKHHMISLICGL